MENLRKRVQESKKGIIVLILILIIILVINYKVVTKIVSEITTKGGYTLQAPIMTVVEGDGFISQIVVNEGTKETFYKSKGVKEKKLEGRRREVKQQLELPNTDNIQSRDILEGREPIGVMRWSSNIKESARYIKYLEEKGYTREVEVRTPQYIEIYLVKEGEVKRVLILEESIMVGEAVEQIEIPTKWEYMQKLVTEEEKEEIKKEEEK